MNGPNIILYCITLRSVGGGDGNPPIELSNHELIIMIKKKGGIMVWLQGS